MKSKFLFALFAFFSLVLSCLSVHAQSIKVPYPCTQLAIHDSTMYNIVQVPYQYEKCKGFLFWRKCQVYTGYRSELQPITQKVQHDSLAICYKDGIIIKDSVIYSTAIGACINGNKTMAIDEKVNVLQALGVKYTRDQVVLASFTGKEKSFETYTAQGFKVLLNIKANHVQEASGTKTADAFPTDIIKYKADLRKLFAVYKPEVAVIENEPYNRKYYTGAKSDYIAELKAAYEVAQEFGITVADGGIANHSIICMYIYRDLYNRGLKDSAEKWAGYTLDAANKREALNDREGRMRETDTLIAGVASLPVPYINVHIYEDGQLSKPFMLQTIARFLQEKTGKLAMTNETGQDNQLPSLVTSMLSEYLAAGFRYAVWWSGSGDNDGSGQAQPLNDLNGSLLPNGKAFSAFNAQ